MASECSLSGEELQVVCMSCCSTLGSAPLISMSSSGKQRSVALSLDVTRWFSKP